MNKLDFPRIKLHHSETKVLKEEEGVKVKQLT